MSLGAQTLTLTNASGLFSGTLQDAGFFPGAGGGLTVASGTETLTGTNTFTGNTTIDVAGFLALSAGGSISDSTVVDDDGIFDISGETAGTSIKSLSGSGQVSLGGQVLTITAGADTFSGTLQDAGFVPGTGGGLEIAGGTETLSGTNTFTGATTIDSGATLVLGAGGATGTVAGNVVDNGLVQFDYGGSVMNANTFSGSGSAEIVAGTAVFTGASAIGGTVTIDPGATMQWGNANPAYLVGSNGVSDNGALVMDFGGSFGSTAAVISGTGSVTLHSGGFNTIGTNTYTGSTTIDPASLFQVSATGSIASSSGVVDNGTFDISGTTAGTSIKSLTGAGQVSLGAQTLTIINAAGTFSGAIVDAGQTPGTGGGVTLMGGTLTLSGANTFTGTTAVNGGTLAAAAANAFSPNSLLAVSAPGSVTLNNFDQTVAGLTGDGNIALGSATLTTNVATTATFAGVISGTGGFTKTGGGVQVLSGVNTYAGATAVNAGTLQAGVANALSADTDVTVASGATFDLNSFDQTIGSLSGAGAVTLGAGTLTTNGNNATTTFSGVITGTGGLTKTGTGELVLTGDSSYTGVTLVNSGVLSVNGTLASAVTVNAGGTLKGIGTVGSLSVANGGTVAPGNSIGTLNVAGNVGFAAGSTYQVELNAAGQSDLIAATGMAALGGGTVQVLVAPGAYAASTTYTILTAASVTGTFASVITNNPFFVPSLTYKPAEVDLTLQSAAALAETPNEIAVANAIQTNPGVLGAAIGLLPESQIPAAFDASSGEVHASIRTALLQSGETLRNMTLARLREAGGTGVWGRLFGTWGGIDGDGNADHLDINFSGLTVGADTAFGDGFRGGVEVGYGQLQGFIGDTRASSLGSDSFHAGAYGGYTDGALSLNGGVIGSWGTVRTERSVRIGTFHDNDRADQSSRTTQVFAEAAYDVALGQIKLAPFANGGWIEASTGPFAERGGAASLSGARGVSDETFITLGAHLSTDIALSQDSDIAPTATIGWLHGFRGLMPTRALTIAATGANFIVTGVPLDKDQAVIDAGIVAHPMPGATLTLGYQGVISGRMTDNGLQLSAAWDF